MNSATSKNKWKKHNSKFEANAHHHSHEDFPHAHVTRPREKQGKQKFKLQCEVNEYLYLTSMH
ncbi:MAG TPA: hypothetical protein VLF09_03785 [Cellvibrio sp.]|nr:hypothetical protein [Cellvibrio sp.]